MATPAAILSILVRADTKAATASLTRLNSQLGASAATANKRSGAMGAAIAKGAKVGGVAVAALGTGSVIAAAKFESSFAEVRKTVDASEKQFKKLETGLRNLAKEIPISVNELNELAGQAGALGIKSKDLLKFTKTAAELGIATDMSAESAANALARLSNIMGTSSKDFRRLGSTFVELGNKGASTESEIAEMALRISGAGETIGLTEAQVLGFASALANVGIRAEAGGSSISRVMLEIQDAVAQGGKELGAFAKIAGVSSEAFARRFAQDAPAAIQMFVEGLDKVKDSGGSVVQTLESVELNELRVRDALLRLGGATGEVTKSQAIANQEWERNNALTTEAERRYETTAAQFQIFKNRINDVAIGLGQHLLPAVNAVMEEIGTGFPQVREFLATNEAIQSIAQAAMDAGAAVVDAGQAIGTAFDTIVRVVGGGVEALRDFWNEASEVRAIIGVGFQVFKTAVSTFIKPFIGALRLLGEMVGPVFSGLEDVVGGAINSIVQIVRGFAQQIRGAVKIITGILTLNFGRVWDGIKDVFAGGARAVLGILKGFLTPFKAAAEAIGGALKNGFVAIWDAIKNAWREGADFVLGIFTTMLDGIAEGADVMSHIPGPIGDMWDKIQAGAEDASDSINGFRETLRSTERVSQETNRKIGRSFAGMSDDARSALHDVDSATGKHMGNAAKVGQDKSGDLRRDVVGNIDSLVSGVSKGLGRVVGNTNKALKAFGVKKQVYINFEAGRGDLPGAQKGAIVGGSAPGDRHTLSLNGVPIAKVESGEKIAVVNREAAKREMALNAAVPRFAKGGALGDVGGLTSAAMQLASNLVNRFGGSVSSGLRPGDDGFHGTGQALDWVGGNWAGASRYVNSIGSQLLEGIYNPSMMGGTAVSWDSGSKVPSSFWGGSTWAGHMDHIHAAAGGKVAAAVKEIARVLLKGPAGPLLDMGQAALDKARKAANDFLAAQMPKMVSHGNLGTTGGMSKSEIASVWTRANRGQGSANLMAAIALAESSGNPRAVGNDPGGTTGLGLWQITTGFNDDLIAKYGGRQAMFDPFKNAQAAGDILSRQGLGAWVVYNTGAYQQYMQEGGIVDIDRIVRQLHGATGPGDRREIVDTTRKRINKRTALDMLTADGGDLSGQLKQLRDQADILGEFASMASQLSITDADGNEIPGIFRGTDEAGWVTQQLDTLFKLRNKLITFGGNAADKTRAVAALVKRIKGPKGILFDLNDRIRELKKRLRDLEDDRKQLERALQDASDRKEKQNKQIERRLQEELDKPPKKRDEKLIKDLRERLRTKSSEKDAIRDELARNRAQTRQANEALAKQTTVRDAVRGPIMGALTTRREALGTGEETLLDHLRTVQGSGVSMDVLTSLPDIGTLGGEIFSAQARLQELGRKQPNITDAPDTTAEQLDLTQQLLRESQQGFAVSQAQYRVFAQTPVMGAFAKGGPVMRTGSYLVGERGPEVVSLAAGQRVHSNQESQGLAPHIEISFANGMGWLDQFVEVKVDGKIRKQARRGGRPLAGRAGLP